MDNHTRTSIRSALTLLTYGEPDQAEAVLEKLNLEQLREARLAGKWLMDVAAGLESDPVLREWNRRTAEIRAAGDDREADARDKAAAAMRPKRKA